MVGQPRSCGYRRDRGIYSAAGYIAVLWRVVLVAVNMGAGFWLYLIVYIALSDSFVGGGWGE